MQNTMERVGRQHEIASLLHALRDHVEDQRAGGMRWLPSSTRLPAAAGAAVAQESAPPAPSQPVAAAANGGGATAETAAAQTIDELVGVLGDCRRCKLAAGRTNIVFGVGSTDADLMFVGEGPGRDEDLRGEPFVGRAGQLLTEIITKGMKLRREDVYIANVVKCRPPQNRNPEPDEIATCIPFLERQIALIQPKVVVALGKFAAQTLAASSTPISKMRGQWHEYCGVKLMPTFHPAYLLRNPGDKRLVWEDIKQVMAELGMAP